VLDVKIKQGKLNKKLDGSWSAFVDIKNRNENIP
jgi:hypothetical protein